jgi:hypothetical protein
VFLGVFRCFFPVVFAGIFSGEVVSFSPWYCWVGGEGSDFFRCACRIYVPAINI